MSAARYSRLGEGFFTPLLYSFSMAAVFAGGLIAIYLDPVPSIPSTITPLTRQELVLLFGPDGWHPPAEESNTLMLDEDGCEIPTWAMEPYQPANPSDFATGRVSFSLRVGEEVIPYPLMSISVMPNEVVTFSGEDAVGRPLVATTNRGRVEEVGIQSWSWRAPSQQGVYSLRVEDSTSGEVISLNAFVMRPYDGGEHINGYRIGRYQSTELDENPRYRRPRGFIEVTPDLVDLWVSPHFQLRQFLCRQESDYPKYLAMSTRLLTKMEVLLEELNDRGIPATSFYIVSAYRTPWYNAQIGNATIYSRHLYGDAVDFLVDVNKDGLFDDLDRTGSTGVGDVSLLREIVTEMERTYRPVSLVGGFGLYEPVPGIRGPFAHIDTRGSAARWEAASEEDSIEVVEASDSAVMNALLPDAKTPTIGKPGRPLSTDLPREKDSSDETRVKPEAIPPGKSEEVEEIDLSPEPEE